MSDRFAKTAIRMRAIRRASAYPTPEDFCTFLGISLSRLSNVENGFPIGRGLQDIIVAKLPGISRSYLVDGSEQTLTGVMLQKLTPLIAEESDTTRPHRGVKMNDIQDKQHQRAEIMLKVLALVEDPLPHGQQQDHFTQKMENKIDAIYQAISRALELPAADNYWDETP